MPPVWRHDFLESHEWFTIYVNNHKNFQKGFKYRSMNNSISFDFQFSNFYCNSYSFDEFTSTYSFDVISNKKTSDIICPRCGAKVHVYDSSTVHLKDMPLRAVRAQNVQPLRAQLNQPISVHLKEPIALNSTT